MFFLPPPNQALLHTLSDYDDRNKGGGKNYQVEKNIKTWLQEYILIKTKLKEIKYTVFF